MPFVQRALTFVGAARHALLPGVTDVCPACLSREAAAQKEQGAGWPGA